MSIVDKGGQLNQYASNLIRKKAGELIGKCGFTKSDLEDIQQDLWLDLISRQSGFDPERGAETTFIAMVINNRFATIIEHRKAEKRDCRTYICSMDDKVDYGNDLSLSRHEVVDQDIYIRTTQKVSRTQVDYQDLRLDVDRAIRSLPPLLRDIALLLCGVSVSEAAQITGIPRTTINEMRNAIRKVFQKKGIDDWLR